MTTWEGAYHWPTKRQISAVEAIKYRENGRLEVGDCWCHEDCYNSNPRKGTKLYPRNRRSCPHFFREKGTFQKSVGCEYYDIQVSKNESTRYSQFYHDLRAWLSTSEARGILHFSEFLEEKSIKYSDFFLKPIIINEVNIDEIEIIILHKNRKRRAKNEHHLRVDLSNWTIEQINDFEKYGKRKIIEEYEHFMNNQKQDAFSLIDVETMTENELDIIPIHSKFSSFKEALDDGFNSENFTEIDQYMRKMIFSIAKEYDEIFSPLERIIQSVSSYFLYLNKYQRPKTHDEMLEWDGKRFDNWDIMDTHVRKCSNWKRKEVKYTSKAKLKRTFSPVMIEKCNEIAIEWYNLESLNVLQNGELKFSLLIKSDHKFPWTCFHFPEMHPRNSLIFQHQVLGRV